jgi:dihydroorotase-like cyclic amidohydrolase
MSERSAEVGSPTESETFMLRGGRVVSMDPAIGDLSVGDVLIDQGRIAAIGSALDGSGIAAVDVSGHVVMPGFVDSHATCGSPRFAVRRRT